MAKFISREKLSKKARKELDNQKRTVWSFSPTTKKVESKKLFNRKESAHAWKDDFGMSAFSLCRIILPKAIIVWIRASANT